MSQDIHRCRPACLPSRCHLPLGHFVASIDMSRDIKRTVSDKNHLSNSVAGYRKCFLVSWKCPVPVVQCDGGVSVATTHHNVENRRSERLSETRRQNPPNASRFYGHAVQCVEKGSCPTEQSRQSSCRTTVFHGIMCP